MRISTKGRYATRLMLDLALNGNNKFIPLKAIAERQGLSDKYLEQIIMQLTKNNMVISSRGSKGGYKLAHPAEFYTVGDILRATEGNLAPVPCLDNGEGCEIAVSCVTVEVWMQIENAVNSVIDNITLADMVKRFQEKNGDNEKTLAICKL